MSGFDDLGRALRDDAERHAPRADSFDVDALTRAARARRAPRLWAAGALAAAAVLGLGGLALSVPGVSVPMLLAGGASSADDSATLESAEDAGGTAGGDGDVASIAALGCGEVVASLERSGSNDGVWLSLDEVVLETTDAASIVMSGELVFQNLGEIAVRLDGDGSPDVVLVDGVGTIVATTEVRGSNGLGLDVRPGSETTVPFVSTLTVCDVEPALSDRDELHAIASLAMSSSEAGDGARTEGVDQGPAQYPSSLVSAPVVVALN